LIYDVKGRFAVHRITKEEAQVCKIKLFKEKKSIFLLNFYFFFFKYKLCKVKKLLVGPKGVPILVTHDGRTIRYPDPHIKVNDTIRLNMENNKIEDFIKFDSGNLVMITGGHNLGRVGVITSRERHPGSFDIVHVKDAANHTFATRLSYVFLIGKGNKPWISLPADKGIRRSITEERERRLAKSQ
jgi:small subunit ribosomal protein S4e